MSLLTQTVPDSSLLINRITNQLKATPRQMMELLVNQWNFAYDSLWSSRGDITPAQKLLALGTDAAELFDTSAALTTFIISQCSGKRDDIVAAMTAKIAAIPAHTIHPDGTITLD